MNMDILKLKAREKSILFGWFVAVTALGLSVDVIGGSTVLGLAKFALHGEEAQLEARQGYLSPEDVSLKMLEARTQGQKDVQAVQANLLKQGKLGVAVEIDYDTKRVAFTSLTTRMQCIGDWSKGKQLVSNIDCPFEAADIPGDKISVSTVTVTPAAEIAAGQSHVLGAHAKAH